ncbi:MAG: hypothetical protein KBC33_01985 [Candidatus Pacebacteria bacterium]|nr:hypothetical protein [Candidatus Paceibacterota bacterium]
MKNTTRPIDAIYAQFGVRGAQELHIFTTKIDQHLMKSRRWDYKKEKLITNEIARILETIDRAGMNDEENEWVDEIIWFWYHHATSCAIFKHKDKVAAQGFAQKAIEYQQRWPDHPNKITWLLYLLVNDRHEEAEAWVKSLPPDHPEKSTAAGTMADYMTVNSFVDLK